MHTCSIEYSHCTHNLDSSNSESENDIIYIDLSDNNALENTQGCGNQKDDQWNPDLKIGMKYEIYTSLYLLIYNFIDPHEDLLPSSNILHTPKKKRAFIGKDFSNESEGMIVILTYSFMTHDLHFSQTN